ncbi:zinc-ribbon and DUF3426 domain-containing protein [Cupriavidus necator]|uniref:MJ0042 finger-like region n=1 Tax=Cupriavidus pinatubonensis (strain JMP 134 / LMG 1197) TaxID=264198 RepID=Q46XA4_CUPPJ|nr:zinc-ribbon and DUF3426 domain-containing protein [Cupriavidus necator]
MAAAKLVTRCPACRTAFRLVADQLRLRQGLVRCGHCETVFDAREHLIEVPAPATSAAAPSPHRQPEPSPPASAPVNTEFEATPASSAAVFDPGYDPGYDVPALDSPTMMMAPAEDEEEAPFDVEDDAVRDPAPSWEPERTPHGVAQPALQEALPEAPVEIQGGHAEETAGEDTELQPTQPEAAEAAQATEASAAEPESEPHNESQLERESVEAEQPEVGPVAAANGLHYAEQDAPHEAPESAAIVTPHAAWPTLDRSAFEDEEPAPAAPDVVQAGAQEDAADEPASEPRAGSPADPVLRSASEFLRAQSSDSTEVPGLADAAPTTYEAGHETRRGYGSDGHDGHEGHDADHESAHASGHEAGPDYGRNLGPTYGPSPGEAFSATAGAIARENATRRWAREEPQMGPAFAPDFLRQARERERAREVAATPSTPRSRYGWHIAAGVLALGVVMQGLYLMRGQLAGHFPALRPVLEAACAPLGCDVPPWRDIDALRIDTSQLQKQEEGSDAYLLAVTLRNQGRATTALPAIELVMTDLQDQLLLRRVLEPSEYLEPAQKTFATHGLRAGMELPVRVRFRTQQAAANYRVLIFYP